MRKHVSLNKGWKFLEHDIASNGSYIRFFKDDFDVSSWADVNVPHDSSIISEFAENNLSGARGGYARTTMCYYNKFFTLSKEEATKRVVVEFEGVYMNALVYVNGEIVGKYPYGYTTFSYDISSFVKEGENRLSVTVDNEPQPASRWYTGTGIYRPVHLHITDEAYLEKNDIFITTPVISQEEATVNIDYKIFNVAKLTKRLIAEVEIKDANGQVVATEKIDKAISYKSYRDVKLELKIANPKLWCNKTPHLYTAVFKIFENGEQLDLAEVKFGIREIKYTPEQGFIINGKKEMLKGVCIHHDNGCLGSAAYREAFVKKIEAVKEMGANAIRTSHNPEAPEFLDLCDEYGMYVMEEAFDEWVLAKRPRIFGDLFIRQRIFSYANYFEEWAEKDISAMVKRDRNHPSIVMWSIGNEIEELRHEEGEGICQMLVNTVHKYDTTRPATAAFNGLAAVNSTNNPEILDICGYNYAEEFYANDHIENSLRCVVGSETASITAFEPRGQYVEFLKDYENKKSEIASGADPEQAAVKSEVASLVNARIVRGENSMIKHLEYDYIAGMFIWTGIDYIGEPTPQTWPSVSSYFAPIDRAYLPKDAFYYYQSCWSDKDVLHILPHWNLKNADIIPVWCFTNCDEVELFVNGKSYGKKTIDKTKTLHFEWDNVKYEEGEVTAIGYRNSKKVEASIKTAYEVSDFEFTTDKTTLAKEELVYTKVVLKDKFGTVVPDKDLKVAFTATGDMSFIACDNGNPTRSDFTSNSVDTLSGYAISIFEGTQLGEGEIIATAEIGGKTVSKKIIITVK
ncbi:MAG: glycoside hydrolase family 2 TIM barrel-domain containing protein [Clostridia bacterium]